MPKWPWFRVPDFSMSWSRSGMVQVNTLHLRNFTLKAKHLVQLATITRLQHLSLDNVTLEARNSIQKLASLQVSSLSSQGVTY